MKIALILWHGITIELRQKSKLKFKRFDFDYMYYLCKCFDKKIRNLHRYQGTNSEIAYTVMCFHKEFEGHYITH